MPTAIGLVALGLAQQSPLQPPPIYITPTMSDAEFCRIENKAALDLMAEVPKRTDPATVFMGLVVVCAAKQLIWQQRIAAPITSMKNGWQERKETEWRNLICENETYAAMSYKDWQYVTKMTFADGQVVFLRATCKGR